MFLQCYQNIKPPIISQYLSNYNEKWKYHDKNELKTVEVITIYYFKEINIYFYVFAFI